MKTRLVLPRDPKFVVSLTALARFATSTPCGLVAGPWQYDARKSGLAAPTSHRHPEYPEYPVADRCFRHRVLIGPVVPGNGPAYLNESGNGW